MTELFTEVDGNLLTLGLVLDGVLPRMSSNAEPLNYLFVLDTTGDGSADWWLAVENRVNASWAVVVTDTESFTGVAMQTGLSARGHVIALSLNLRDIGDPGQLSVCATTQLADNAGGVVSTDRVPDQDDCTLSAGRWVEVR